MTFADLYALLWLGVVAFIGCALIRLGTAGFDIADAIRNRTRDHEEW